MKSYILLLLSFPAVGLCIPCAAWDTGQQWPASIRYETSFYTDSVICGDMAVDLDGSAAGTWTYQGLESRQHPVSGLVMNMHRFEFSGPGQGNASFEHDDYCFGWSDWEQPVQITLWLDGSTLNPVTVSLYHPIDGTWSWILGGEYEDDCEGHVQFDVNYDPYYPDFDWPLETGKTWNLEINTVGKLEALWEGWIGDWGEYYHYPIRTIDTQTSIDSIVGEQTVINGCLSYPVNHSDYGKSDWCPESNWYSRRMSDYLDWDIQIPATPFPTATPFTPVPTPTPTATPNRCEETGASIDMPYVYYSTGYDCWVNILVCNPGTEPLTGYPLFVLLEVYGHIFFAPGFTQEPCSFREASAVYPSGLTEMPVLQEFTWPAGSGSGSATWYAAFLEPDMSTLFGEIGHRGFFWHE